MPALPSLEQRSRIGRRIDLELFGLWRQVPSAGPDGNASHEPSRLLQRCPTAVHRQKGRGRDLRHLGRRLRRSQVHSRVQHRRDDHARHLAGLLRLGNVRLCSDHRLYGDGDHRLGRRHLVHHQVGRGILRDVRHSEERVVLNRRGAWRRTDRPNVQPR